MRVDYITHMGDDLLVVNAARVSLNKHHDTFMDSDERLINYLAEHNHWTPTGHPHVCLRITVPFFVANQLKRHQVGFVINEVSRRYVDSEPEFYVTDQFGKRASNKKQGAIEGEFIFGLQTWLEYTNEDALSNYEYLLKRDVAPEDARMVLPLNTYTSWYWTGSLAAWARLYNLRIKLDAQRQTREVAQMIGDIMQPLFPHSWEALTT